jgi:hypothetical protein
MKKILLILSIALAQTLLAQSPDIQWQHALGGSGDDFFNSVKNTPDGGYILAGYTSSNDSDVAGNNGLSDYWVIKLDQAGAIEWQKCYGGTNEDRAQWIQVTPDHGYIIAGYSESVDGDITAHHASADTADCWIIKTDSLGNIEWERSLGGTSWEASTCIQNTIDGGYIMVATTESYDGDISSTHGGSDYWVVKLSSSGNIQWQKTYGGTSYDNPSFVIQLADESYMVTGHAYSADGDLTSNHGVSDYWIIHLDTAGNIIWQKNYGGSFQDESINLIQTSDGGFMVAGFTNSTDGDVSSHFSVSEYWLVKIDSLGILQWEKAYGGQGSEFNTFVDQTADGGYIISGGSGSNTGDVSFNHGVSDCWIVKTDPLGNIVWERSFGGPWFDSASEIIPTPGGGYIIAGRSMFTGGDLTECNGAYDGWVIRLNNDVGIDLTPQEINVRVYPNPFTQYVNIDFANPFNKQHRLQVFNSHGQLVISLQNITTNHVRIDKNTLTAGLYFFRLETGDRSIGKGKLIVE